MKVECDKEKLAGRACGKQEEGLDESTFLASSSHTFFFFFNQ